MEGRRAVNLFLLETDAGGGRGEFGDALAGAAGSGGRDRGSGVRGQCAEGGRNFLRWWGVGGLDSGESERKCVCGILPGGPNERLLQRVFAAVVRRRLE